LLVLSPLLVNVVIRTYGWIAILGPNGLLEKGFRTMGLGAPPKLLFTETAVVIGLTHLLLAYMVLGIVSSLDNINPSLVNAARNLGSSNFGAFRKITLPLSVPGMVSGCFLVFTHACGSLITPALLGGNSGVTLPTLIYQQELTLFNWPLGSAMSLILLIVIGASLLLYGVLVRSLLTRKEPGR
jgi:putative spermidine/putrescine transport system permease protein